MTTDPLFRTCGLLPTWDPVSGRDLFCWCAVSWIVEIGGGIKLNNKEWVVKLQADGMGWGGVMRVEEIRDGLGL